MGNKTRPAAAGKYSAKARGSFGEIVEAVIP
jgi:hypothetical protein